ncbi:TRAP transporter small permease [Piscinibacter sp. XHJ-5]|uniref:TRAP transporter small permease n=1 Tax=Piscinibacter sp. XHJ-5 TaxID=3037797 RepID=UPI002452D0FD|nr:TRAP transporter small permease [Piscinibacter sp. XHJ-5]
MTKGLSAIDRGVELLVAAILAAMVVVGTLQVLHRLVLNSSLSWSEEAQVFGHIGVVFLGIPVAYRRGAHLFIDTFRDMYPPLVRAGFDLLVELMWFSFAVSLMALGWQVSRVAALQESPGLEVPMSYPYYAMVAGGAYLALVALQRMVAWGRQHIDRVKS